MHPRRSARRTIAVGLVAGLLLGLVPATMAAADVAEVCEGAAPHGFTDRSAISPVFVEVVDCLAAYGITLGLPDGRFAPGDPVTRQQMALFVARFVAQAQQGTTAVPATAPDAFGDLDSGVPDAQRRAINWLASLGIATGATSATFDPGGTVTREQMASFLARALAVTGAFDAVSLPEVVAAADGTPFPDLAEVSAPHRLNVQALQALGIVSGRDDGTYGPGAQVTRQQMAQFLMRSAGTLAAAGLWGGRFLGASPEVPEVPETPETGPDDQPPTDDTDQAPETPTNQSFEVTADAVQVPTGTRVAVTARLSADEPSPDADTDPLPTVSVWLLDPDAVDPGDAATGLVTLDADIASRLDPAAILDVDDGITIVEVAGAPVEPSTAVVVDAPAATLELVIDATPQGPGGFVVLIAATGDERPGLAADGQPLDDFGVSDPVAVQDVAGLLLLDADALPETVPILGSVPDPTTDPIGSLVRPVDADVELVVRLLDVDDPTAADAGTVPLDGTIDYVVVDVDDPAACSTSVTFGQVDDADVVDGARGTVNLVAGEANLVIPGGGEGEVRCLLTDWQGQGAYADEQAGNLPIPTHGAVRFSDQDPVVTAAVFLGPAQVFVPRGTETGVAVLVVDQFGNPASDVEVTFTRDVDVFDPTTLPQTGPQAVDDDTGVAVQPITSSVNRRAQVTAEVASTPPIAVPGSVSVTWFDPATGPSTPATAGEDYLGVVEVAGDDDWVVIDVGVLGGRAPGDQGPFLRLDYGDPADTYRLAGQVTDDVDVFRTAIGAESAVGQVLEVTNYLDDRAPGATEPAVFDLRAAAAVTLTAVGGSGLVAGDDAEVALTSLTGVDGEPVQGATIVAALTGASGPTVGAGVTDAQGQATLTYASVAADAGVTVSAVLSTTHRGEVYAAAAVSLGFADGLVGAVVTKAGPEPNDQVLTTDDVLTLTFSAPAALGASPAVRLARQGQAPVTLTDGDGGNATFAVVNGTVAVTVTGEDLVTAGLSEHVVEQLTGITVGDPVVVPTDRPVPVGVGGAA